MRGKPTRTRPPARRRGTPRQILKRRSKTIALASAALMLLWTLPAVSAGSGDDASDILHDLNRLEADRWDETQQACRGDSDGEHTRSRHRDWATEERVVFLPHSGCWTDYEDVDILDPRLFTAYRLDTTGDLGRHDARIEVRVLADDTVIARDVYDHDGGDHDPHTRLFEPDSLRPVLPGTRTIRITYRVLSGPNYININVDYLESVPLSCTDIPSPEVEGITLDGMGDGTAVWQGRDYDLGIEASGLPDGATVEWTLPDGRTLAGDEVTTHLESPGYRQIQAVVHVPVADCEELEEFHIRVPLDVQVLELPRVAFTPSQGESCIAGEVLPSVDGEDRIVQGCRIEVALDDAYGMAYGELDPRIEVAQDGTLLDVGQGAGTLRLDYRSDDHAPGAHTFRACATFPDDVHDVEVCGTRTLVNERPADRL